MANGIEPGQHASVATEIPHPGKSRCWNPCARRSDDTDARREARRRFGRSDSPGGIFATIILEIIGAVVGGFLGTLFGFGDISGFDPRSMSLAVGGGIVVLLIYRLVAKGRA